jgi:hypothetical protein
MIHLTWVIVWLSHCTVAVAESTASSIETPIESGNVSPVQWKQWTADG